MTTTTTIRSTCTGRVETAAAAVGLPSCSRLGRALDALRSDRGAATAEYAIVIMAAVGFAGVLLAVMRSDEVRGVLSDLVRSALSVG
jgi:hypothetical protein